jgi:hypothetical protein
VAGEPDGDIIPKSLKWRHEVVFRIYTIYRPRPSRPRPCRPGGDMGLGSYGEHVPLRLSIGLSQVVVSGAAFPTTATWLAAALLRAGGVHSF